MCNELHLMMLTLLVRLSNYHEYLRNPNYPPIFRHIYRAGCSITQISFNPVSPRHVSVFSGTDSCEHLPNLSSVAMRVSRLFSFSSLLLLIATIASVFADNVERYAENFLSILNELIVCILYQKPYMT